MSWMTVAGLLATLGATKMQMQAAQEAKQRADQAIMRSLENQRRLQMEAENRAMVTAKQFAPEDRIDNQSNIEEQLNADLIAPIEKNHTIASEMPGTTGNVSSDYNTAKAQSDLNVLKSSRELARIMSKISSANRLRMNEGIGMMDTGRDIDMLNNFSKSQQGADNIAIQQAGQIDPRKTFGSQVLGALGTAGMVYGGSSGAGRTGGPAPVYDHSSPAPRTYSFGLNPNKKSTFSMT